MTALSNKAGHYIFALWFLSSFFSPNLSSRRLDVYFYTWCGSSTNLECRSEMCCMWLAENAGPKKSPSGHHHTTLSGYIFATKARIHNQKKTNSNISSTCLHNMVNFSPLAAEIRWRVWGTLANFNRFRILAALLHDTLVVGVSQTLWR